MPAASDGEHVEGCESDSESFLLCARSLKQQRDTYQDFVPMFQQMCKLASAPGEPGEKYHEIMNKRLKRLRREIFGASVNFDKDLACVYCASHPVISSKKLRAGKNGN